MKCISKGGDRVSLYETLYPFQKNIVDKFKDRDRYGLFLDCGLGKTLVSLAFTEVNNCTKVIIISINSKATEDENVKGSWLWWAKRSNIKYNLWDKRIFKPTKKRPNTFSKETNDVLLLNFESLHSRENNPRVKNPLKKELVEFIATCKGHNTAIIIDESHKVKDTSTVQNKSVNKLYALCKATAKKTYMYLGTGTIFTSGLIDTYAQLKLLGWEGSKTLFQDLFCIRGQLPNLLDYQQPIVDYKNVDKLYDLIHQYGITIKSEEVIDLPEKIFVDHVHPASLEFRLLNLCKFNQKELYTFMKERTNLPYLIDDTIYASMDYEEKEAYLSRLHITIEDDKLMLEGGYEVGDITTPYTEFMNFLATIFENLEDLEGAFEWMYDFYYLFVRKEELNEKKEVIRRWYEVKKYKPKRLTNNPFYRNFAYPDPHWEGKTKGTAWMRARQMCSGFQGNAEGYIWYDYTRLNMVREFLEEHENNYIIFYNYTPELLELYKICEELGYNIDVYSGEIKSLNFYNIYESQTDDQKFSNKKNVILANFASGSTGKNWQEYNQCIIFSTPIFNHYEQGIKRIHRTGQKDTCVYHTFYSDNFLDEGMREALANNGEYNDDMFEADSERINALMQEEEDDE